MIHYNVWFSFADGADPETGLKRVRVLLDGFKSRDLIADYSVLKNRAEDGKTKMPPFQVIIQFRDNEQFTLPFAEVAKIGVHDGEHGDMIRHVQEFVVEVFEQF